MNKSINEQIQIYKNSVNNNSLSSTYKFLMDFMNQLQREFDKRIENIFIVKKVLNGYLNYTYFYFENDFFKKRNLKLAIVLNHQKMCFEIWLIGTTKKVQKKYWAKFKNTKWNKEEIMPQWYVISIELLSNPNFEELNKLTDSIVNRFP